MVGAAVLVGEPGIGKSRLIDALRHDEAQESVRYLSLQCSPLHQFSSLHPVKDYLDWVSGVNVDDPPETRRDKLRRLFQSAWQANEEQTAVLMDVVASSGPGQEANADIGILLKRRMAFQILSRKVFSTAMPGRPLFLVFEDVHWIDPTSAEFLENLVRNAPDHAAVVLATTRPEGPFADRLNTLGEVVRLDRLSDAEALELAKAAGRTAGLDDKTLQAIVEKSDGVPLFLEEYALMLAENLGARQGTGATELRSIPLTLGGLVQNKLDRLNPHAQKVARIGAAVGRVFDLRLVRSLSELGKDAFDKALDALETADIAHRDAGIGSRRAASFKHALVQDAVYASLSTAERRRLHGTVADAMLAEEDGRRMAAEVLAKHLLEAGRNAESAEWRLAAAMAAAGEGSAAEALAHITQGLAAIESLPEGRERDRLELRLRAIEGPTLMVTRGPGSPAFGAAQARALTLLRGQDNPDNLIPVIYNTALHAWACGRLADADAVTDEIFEILEAEPSDGAFLAAHTMRGLVAWHRGDNAAALAHLSATVERYDPALHREFYTRFLKEFGVFGSFYLGLTHTVMGDTEAGARLARSALDIAKLVKRPHAYGFGLLANFVTAILRGDVPTAGALQRGKSRICRAAGLSRIRRHVARLPGLGKSPARPDRSRNPADGGGRRALGDDRLRELAGILRNAAVGCLCRGRAARRCDRPARPARRKGGAFRRSAVRATLGPFESDAALRQGRFGRRGAEPSDRGGVCKAEQGSNLGRRLVSAGVAPWTGPPARAVAA